jgi:hypothetical protein
LLRYPALHPAKVFLRRGRNAIHVPPSSFDPVAELCGGEDERQMNSR